MWRSFARQLSNPVGPVGVAVGTLMKFANREPIRLAIAALDIQPGHDVLDLGCGPGQAVSAALALADPGIVTGLDQSPTMIAQAIAGNRRTVKSGKTCFVAGQFHDLPFGDNAFDRVLAANVMYFWHDTARVISEIRRVLRPGGRLALYLTSAETMQHWKIAQAGTHRLFDADAVTQALIRAGFAAENVIVERVELSGGVIGLVATADTGSEGMAN
jgi:ubiquinone/menaquinone biosynthesis C-methylase UbiE